MRIPRTVWVSLFVLSAAFASQGDFAEYFTEEASLVQKDAPIVMPPVPASDESNADAPIPEQGDVVEQVAALLGSETASRDMLDSEDLAQVEASSEGFGHMSQQKKAQASGMMKSVFRNLGVRHYKSYMSSSSSILKPKLPPNRFEGHMDDAEDARYNSHKKNSQGLNRIYGKGHNSKIMKNGKVRSPGYTIDDASTGPEGHFYIGQSRRRIGGGFGRRRRSHLERENKFAEREHKRLLAANYARRNARNERNNKSCSFKICPKGTPGYKRWHSPKPCTPRPRDCEKNLWCVTGKCKVIRSYNSGYTSGTTKSMFRAVAKAVRKKHNTGNMVKKALQRTARVVAKLKAASVAQKAKSGGLTKSQTAKLVKYKAASKKKKRLMKMRLAKLKLAKMKRIKMMKWRAMMRKKEIAKAKARIAAKRFKKLVHQVAKGCKLEHDMDYRGSDLKRYHKVATSMRCAKLCAANKKCKSFTWGRAKGKWYTNVCFLKHHRYGKRVKMVGVDSGHPCKTKSKKKERFPRVYQHCNFGGYKKVLKHSVDWVAKLGVKNDDLSSIEVPAGKCVTLYQHSHYKGKSWKICGRDRIKCFVRHKMLGGTSWNDQVSSIKVSNNSNNAKTKEQKQMDDKGCEVQRNMDYRGSDLKRYHNVPTTTQCAKLCVANKKCKAFTWGRAKGKWYTHVCFLKHTKWGKHVKMVGVDSGHPEQCPAAGGSEHEHEHEGSGSAHGGEYGGAQPSASGHGFNHAFNHAGYGGAQPSGSAHGGEYGGAQPSGSGFAAPASASGHGDGYGFNHAFNHAGYGGAQPSGSGFAAPVSEHEHLRL